MEIKKEKSFGMGVMGALVGSLIGALSIILLAQLGVVSAISGFVLAFCTLKGFELLGGKLEKKSIALCIVIMLIVPYFADRLSWAIAYNDVFLENGVEMAFGDIFMYVPEFVEIDELTGEYIKNLVFVYAFTALGAFTIVKQAIKQKDAVIEEAPDAEVIEEAPVEE